LNDKDKCPSSTCGYPVSLTPLVLHPVFSPLHSFGTCDKNQMGVAVWAYLGPLIYFLGLYQFLCQYMLFVTIPLKPNLKPGIVMPPALLFLFRIALSSRKYFVLAREL
jgi:hypothetical protein